LCLLGGQAVTVALNDRWPLRIEYGYMLHPEGQKERHAVNEINGRFISQQIPVKSGVILKVFLQPHVG
jgi:hypothetical protein